MIPIISLVSGTWNRLPLLQQMVQSFRDNLLPGMTYEVVIVDGGSTDGTIEWCKLQGDVILIEEGELRGAIKAFTNGAKAAQGKYVLIANDDIQFKQGSIIPAIVHLENNMKCGAVAFRDNRPVGNYTSKDYKTLQMEGNLNGKHIGIIYAQVGLFRGWLGNRLNWWLGEHEEMKGSWTYAGDNSLSAQIWHYGYSVDEVAECIVEDYVASDGLREVNYRKGLDSNDSKFFYQQWPQGVIVSNEPKIPQQDRRAARILYLPIYEPGWAVQKDPIHGKNGLRKALSRATNKYGATHIVQEFDYLAVDPKSLRNRLIELTDTFKPDLILTQLQSPLPLTADLLRELKQRTGATVINWNGDQAIGGLYSPQMLPILRQIDLQLITNLDVVADYEREGIKWAYWQIGYEESADDENTQAVADSYFHEQGRSSPFISDTNFPVVFLASLRSPERMAIAEIVQEFGGKSFNPGDEFASLYNFSVTKAIYRKAKIAISDNGFQSRGFVSNRLFQALAAGNCVVLQQHVDGLDELTGLKAWEHYYEWTTLEHLKSWLEKLSDPYYLNEAQATVTAGTAFVRANFSFDAQVAKLMTLIKERLGEGSSIKDTTALMYKGRNQFGFGLGNSFTSGMRYEVEPGRLLHVKNEDLAQILALYPEQFEKMEVD